MSSMRRFEGTGKNKTKIFLVLLLRFNFFSHGFMQLKCLHNSASFWQFKSLTIYEIMKTVNTWKFYFFFIVIPISISAC